MRYISRKLVLSCLAINVIHYWIYAAMVYYEDGPIIEWLTWSLWSVPSIIAFDVTVFIGCCLIDPVKNALRHFQDKIKYKKLLQVKELYDGGILDDEEYAQEILIIKGGKRTY